ncbi:MAG: hypothetical protein PHW82_06555 [Bacteroidales bacterium]|nr:hypothetical protein [Bacteroidales bacterium]
MIETNYDILQKLTNSNFALNKRLNELCENPDLVDAYIEYTLSENKFAWRASWVISHFACKHPEKVQKFADILINNLNNISKDGHIRETLKTIYKLKLNENQISTVFDFCMRILEDNKRQASVRMIAFNFVLRVAEIYPELQNEISIIVENIKDYLSPGIRNSFIKRLNKLKNN